MIIDMILKLANINGFGHRSGKLTDFCRKDKF